MALNYDTAADTQSSPSQRLGGLEFTPDWELVQRGYQVRFARNESDLDAICHLRFEVFNLELGEGFAESYETGQDRDPFDAQCQHLMVTHTSSSEVVGTYRMQVAEQAHAGAGFYSAGEFDLSALPSEVHDHTVELGRACVAVKHRSRRVLGLLFRGLMSYVLFNKRRYFFGCSSLTNTDPRVGLRAFEQLRSAGHVHPDFELPPLPAYDCRRAGLLPAMEKVKIPKLFGIYLRQGAKVCGPPALDREFGTIDFLTLLDVTQMDRAFYDSITD